MLKIYAGCFASLVGVWLLCSTAAAAQSKTALSWVRLPGADGCIAATELGRRVERMVGPVLATAAEGEVSIEGHVGRRGDGFEAHIKVTDAAGSILGERVLRSAAGGCRALDESLVFVIAVAIDPNAALAELPAEFAPGRDVGGELLAELRAHPQQVRARPPSAPLPEVAAPVESPPPANEPPLQLWVAAGLAMGLGWAAAPSPGVSLQAALSVQSWSLRVRGFGWLEQPKTIDVRGEVALQQWGLDAAACPQLWTARRWAMSLCAQVVIAHLSAQPHGFSGNASAGWLVGPGAGARVERALGGTLFFALDVEAQSLWPRRRVVFQEAGQPRAVFRTRPLAGSSSVSAGLRF